MYLLCDIIVESYTEICYLKLPAYPPLRVKSLLTANRRRCEMVDAVGIEQNLSEAYTQYSKQWNKYYLNNRYRPQDIDELLINAEIPMPHRAHIREFIISRQ